MQRAPLASPTMMMRQQQPQQSARRRRPNTMTTTPRRRNGFCTVFLRISLIGVILWMMHSHKLEVERQTELIDMHHALPMTTVSSSIPTRTPPSKQLHLQQQQKQQLGRNAAAVDVPPEVKIVQAPQPLPKDVEEEDNVAPPPDIHDPQPTVTNTANNTTTNTASTSSSRHGVSSAASIPIFYNLYVRNDADVPRVEKIVDEQLRKLIEGVHGPVYVNAIGASLPIPNTTLIGRYEEASEMVTLQSLWEYCRNPEHHHQKVVYLHRCVCCRQNTTSLESLAPSSEGSKSTDSLSFCHFSSLQQRKLFKQYQEWSTPAVPYHGCTVAGVCQPARGYVQRL